MASSWAELEKEILDHMRAATSAVESKALSVMHEEVNTFYAAPEGWLYHRTNQLKNSPASTGLGGTNPISFDYYLQPGDYPPNPAFTAYGWGTGHTGYTVMTSAEQGTDYVKGNPGFWGRATARMEQEANSIFASYFP